MDKLDKSGAWLFLSVLAITTGVILTLTPVSWVTATVLIVAWFMGVGAVLTVYKK